MRRLALLALVPLSALALGACGGDDEGTAPTVAPTTAPDAAPDTAAPDDGSDATTVDTLPGGIDTGSMPDWMTDAPGPDAAPDEIRAYLVRVYTDIFDGDQACFEDAVAKIPDRLLAQFTEGDPSEEPPMDPESMEAYMALVQCFAGTSP